MLTKISKEQLPVSSPRPYLGCDPELFIATDKGIVGAERVIPKAGLIARGWASNSKIVLDGVQLELHPPPCTCRQSLGAYIGRLFADFERALKDKNGGFKASFDPVISVSKKELDSLSDEAKVLGCAPSLNSYDPKATIKVSKRNARVRSAGGHIHIGFASRVVKSLLKTDRVVKMVQLLDVLVGLPCVLIDRDPNQAKRRRVYGRAGEYRLPPHGIEYRVPSNFWLHHYYLMHFVTGMCRLACNVFVVSYTPSCKGFNFADDLLSKVNIKKVVRAINRNNYDLALEQWLPVAAWIDEHVPSSVSSGLWSGLTDDFLYFAEKVHEKGLKYWFPADPLDHWVRNKTGTPGAGGFESFLVTKVQRERLHKVTSEDLPKAA